jgi:hypothetical protein
MKAPDIKPVKEMQYHQTSEKLVGILCNKTQNTNPLFFRILVAYYFSMVASMMRCNIKTLDRGEIPVNMYAINLATSGTGKGHSTNILEEQVINQFRNKFTEQTFPLLAEVNLPKLAQKRAQRKGTDPDEELERTMKEFERLGPLVFSFDSGTSAAVKQVRHKLLMANAGSLNLQIDEIGSNLMGNMEVLNTFLELYDVGKIKQKLVKNTADNIRHEEIPGRTPTNMMLFGTPSRLLNGGKAEDEFYSMLDTGYSRRSFFGYAKGHTRNTELTPQEVLAQRIDTSTHEFLGELSYRLGNLADMMNMNASLAVSEEVTLLFIRYQIDCERAAENLPEHEEMKKAELSHRHFKVLKLAGAYAFVDGSPEITEEHAYNAIKLAEESGEAFQQLLTRDRPYVKLAKYIASVGRSVTQADLVEDLPFYKGSIAQKQETMQLAIAYGYQNNIVIKKTFNDGIEFLQGETLKATNLDKIRVSYSTDIAQGYKEDYAPWEQLHKLTQIAGMHWINHHVKGGHRQEDSIIPGFNIVVIDVDGGVNLSTAQMLLQEYKSMFYTTKRHTEADQRFRIILPTNFELALDVKDYKEFMANLFEWLPFEVDSATGQRARKWLSHKGNYFYQEGNLLDVLPFIPKTSKNEEHKKIINDLQALDNLERWVINTTGDGNRNKQLHRYAMILVDAGFDFEGVRQRVTSLNDKLPDRLTESELLSTILVTVGKAIAKR